MDKVEIKKLVEEVKETQKRASLSSRDKIAIEQKIFKVLLEKEGKCSKCGQIEKFSLDHIVPNHLLACFGVDTAKEIIEDNYCLLCRVCNMYKGSRLDFTHPNTKTILLRLLEKI